MGVQLLPLALVFVTTLEGDISAEGSLIGNQLEASRPWSSTLPPSLKILESDHPVVGAQVATLMAA